MKKFYIALGIIGIMIALHFVITKMNKQENDYAQYSFSVSVDNKVIENNIINIQDKESAKFDINFSARTGNYEKSGESYNLYVFLNYKNVKFYADGRECFNTYNFKLDKSEKDIDIKVDIPLKFIDNPDELLVCIVPENCTSNNYQDGMAIMYTLNDGKKKMIQSKISYDEYKILNNISLQGMLINQDFDTEKDKNFTILKSVDIKRTEDLRLAFRTSNITSCTNKNLEYVLLITVDGILDEKNIYVFNEPDINEVLYKRIDLSLNKGKKDVIAYLIAKNSEYEGSFENFYIDRLIVNVQ